MSDITFAQVFQHSVASESLYAIQRKKYGSKRVNAAPENSMSMNRLGLSPVRGIVTDYVDEASPPPLSTTSNLNGSLGGGSGSAAAASPSLRGGASGSPSSSSSKTPSSSPFRPAQNPAGGSGGALQASTAAALKSDGVSEATQAFIHGVLTGTAATLSPVPGLGPYSTRGEGGSGSGAPLGPSSRANISGSSSGSGGGGSAPTSTSTYNSSGIGGGVSHESPSLLASSLYSPSSHQGQAPFGSPSSRRALSSLSSPSPSPSPQAGSSGTATALAMLTGSPQAVAIGTRTDPLFLSSDSPGGGSAGSAPDVSFDESLMEGSTRRSDYGMPLRETATVAMPTTVRSSLKDQNVLARSMHRSGNSKDEAKAHFQSGVLLDSRRQFAAAIECYKKYLAACHRNEDSEGEARAYNHMGVDYQILGGEYLPLAVACHTKHLEVSPLAGRFVSYYNIGLCLAAMGEDDKAAESLQMAVQYATQTNDDAGMRMACGQLAVTLGRLNQYEKAKELMCQRLALAGSDVEDRIVAHKQLGDLARDHNDFEEAWTNYHESAELAESTDLRAAGESYLSLALYCNRERDYERSKLTYERALDIGLHLEDASIVKRARCGVGIAVGSQSLGEVFAEVAARLREPPFTPHSLYSPSKA